MSKWEKFNKWLSDYVFLHLKREKDNPYTYRCSRCSQTFITIGDRDRVYPDFLTYGGEIVDKNCPCIKRFAQSPEWAYPRLTGEG